jgi:dolichyl-phosphate-mannose--protein O-mannosyl transferase
MTASNAGDPAMDPGDARPGATGPDILDPVTVRPAQPGPSERPRTGGDAAVGAHEGGADSGLADLGQAGPDRAGSRERIAAIGGRLMSPMPADRLWGWVGPLVVTAFAAVLRFSRLSVPHAVDYDESSYIKDAWSILQHGVEWNPIANPAGYPPGQSYVNNLLLSGGTHIFAPCSGYSCGEAVVHPEVGKYLIAIGEWVFGLNPFGYRVASAVFGSLAILLMCRIARRLTRSTLLGCIAGLLLSLDGMEFVLSRTGILDIFLMFFVLAAFGAMLIDRDVSRSRLAEAVVLRPGDEAGPGLGIRKWRVLAGLLIGLACAVKQDASWYIPAFIGLSVAWDISARRAAGLRASWYGGIVRDGKWLPLTLVVVPFVTYVVTWINWMVTQTGYYRDYARTLGVRTPVIEALYSLFKYHQSTFGFDIHLRAQHPYMSQPWDWIVLSRPVSFYYAGYTNAAGTHPCPATGCPPGPSWSQEVLPLGNPAIWWVSIPAVLFCLGWWLTRRDWRAGASLLGIIAGWLPWFLFLKRTPQFDYYSLDFLPFLVLCITLCLGLIIGPARASPRRRAIGAAIAGTYVLAVLILFWYFYPILAGQIIPHSWWSARMWYRGWI